MEIAKIPDNIQRPFWSVMIPTYNPEPEFLEQTITCILAQQASSEEMQIEILDDCSSKFDPKTLVNDLSNGRISYYRQPHHLGIGQNWNTCISRARGHWVHILHQDDLILPDFYRRLQQGIQNDNKVGAAFCRHFFVDERGKRRLPDRLSEEETGILSNWIEHVFVGLSIAFPAIVVKRRVYEQLGGFNSNFQYALDWDMWKRIAARYPIWYEAKPLACFRIHKSSLTSNLIETGENIAEIKKSIEIAQSYLEKPNPVIAKRAKENYTTFAIDLGFQMLFRLKLKAAYSQFREAYLLNSDLKFLKALIKFFVYGIQRQVHSFYMPVQETMKS